MLRVLRIALQIALFFLLRSVVSGVGSGDTGTIEKGVLGALGGALIGWLVGRFGR